MNLINVFVSYHLTTIKAYQLQSEEVKTAPTLLCLHRAGGSAVFPHLSSRIANAYFSIGHLRLRKGMLLSNVPTLEMSERNLLRENNSIVWLKTSPQNTSALQTELWASVVAKKPCYLDLSNS